MAKLHRRLHERCAEICEFCATSDIKEQGIERLRHVSVAVRSASILSMITRYLELGVRTYWNNASWLLQAFIVNHRCSHRELCMRCKDLYLSKSTLEAYLTDWIILHIRLISFLCLLFFGQRSLESLALVPLEQLYPSSQRWRSLWHTAKSPPAKSASQCLAAGHKGPVFATVLLA